MKRIELVRQSTSNDGTFGELFDDGKAFCFTLELPWRGNKKNVSCIPEGIYRCELITRPERDKDGREVKAYLLEKVPGRSAILIHPGNTIDDIKGCILLGRHRGTKGGKPAVLNSQDAVKDFITAMGGKPFELVIRTAGAM